MVKYPITEADVVDIIWENIPAKEKKTYKMKLLEFHYGEEVKEIILRANGKRWLIIAREITD